MHAEQEQVMQIIQKLLQGLHPPLTIIHCVSYREGQNPLIYVVAGQVEPVKVHSH
jgi:hypothetical protein